MVETKVRKVARTHVPQPSATPEQAPPPKAATREEPPKEKYAPKSDAPFHSVARLFIGAIHLAVLVGIVALLIAYGMAALRSSKNMAVATVVGPQIEPLVARVGGMFRVVQPIPPGGKVAKGQVIGVVDSPEHTDKLELARRRLKDLQREILVAMQSSRTFPSDTQDQPIRQLRLEANHVQSEVAQLEELAKDLVVRSPFDGTIPFGLSGGKEVEKNERLTEIWPTGSELRIEINAPLKYVDEILAEGRVECRFATPEGELVVTATPIRESRQMKLSENDENRADKQVDGLLVCIPDGDAAQKLLPGLVGSL